MVPTKVLSLPWSLLMLWIIEVMTVFVYPIFLDGE